MLMVKTWRGERLLFRYYDPRVLRVYLPTCTSEELKTVFGPIQQFYAENESATSLMQFNFVRGKLAHSEVTVTASDLTASNG
jgi:hypothetical protein